MTYQVKSFSFVFLENLGHHKLFSKLTDLYFQINLRYCQKLKRFFNKWGNKPKFWQTNQNSDHEGRQHQI